MLYTFPCSQSVEEQRESIQNTEDEALGRGQLQGKSLRCWHGAAARYALGNQLPHKASYECQPAPLAVPEQCQQGFKPMPVLSDNTRILPQQAAGSWASPHCLLTTGTATGGEPGHPRSWEQRNRTPQ